MDVDRVHSSVMSQRMVLGEVVGKVGCSRFPVDGVLASLDTITKPVESHVDGFGTTLLDGVVEDASGIGVVYGDGGGWLNVAKEV